MDENGFDTRLIRTHARAPRAAGAPPGSAPGGCWEPGGRWERPAPVGALALDGFRAAMAVPAATGAAVFPPSVAEVLIPAPRKRRPGAAVVMDNPAAHKAASMREAFDRAGIGHRCLPAYSPDMNPIEQAWSKLKAHLRAGAARSRVALERAVPVALGTITAGDAQGWFRHTGCQPS